MFSLYTKFYFLEKSFRVENVSAKEIVTINQPSIESTLKENTFSQEIRLHYGCICWKCLWYINDFLSFLNSDHHVLTFGRDRETHTAGRTIFK